jgi:hypothetical protein
MKRLLALLLSYASVEAKSIVTEEYLDRVAMIESNYNYDAVGDKGKAIGAWQMHEPAWREACQSLSRTTVSSFLPWDDFAKNHKMFAKDPQVSRLVAKEYLQILERHMNRAKVAVTPISLYMAYNMGFSGAYDKAFNPKSFWLDSKRKSILARANTILSR